MMDPPDLIFMADFPGWESYEDAIYRVYLETIVEAKPTFCGSPIRVRFRPLTNRKGHGFWHLISEAPDQRNRNEEDRVPDPRRCERVRWIAWCIRNADVGILGFSWWENRRGRETHVVIWAEKHDFVVVLAKRQTEAGPRYYLLKTAYCLAPRKVRQFTQERDTWRDKQKG